MGKGQNQASKDISIIDKEMDLSWLGSWCFRGLIRNWGGKRRGKGRWGKHHHFEEGNLKRLRA